jgi:flagellar basal-body rod protein FlgG
MSIRALHSGASGMNAQQFNLDVIANNLANAGTTGFKRTRSNFEDIYYQNIKLPGQLNNLQQATPTGIAVGTGVRVQSTQLNMEQGSLVTTEGNLDIAIVGEGFLQVNDGTQILYTRAGNLAVNSQGQIVIESADRGYLIEPPLQVPQQATDISISADGQVTALEPGQSQPTQVGQIQMAKFINPSGLLQVGENFYRESLASGPPQTGLPGLDGRGTVRQGFLESSNTDAVNELVDLIKTQRNFELNSQVVQAADQMLQLTANLRRY